jgi:ABC-type phosphate/phosphonate transport system substrate-binding protein
MLSIMLVCALAPMRPVVAAEKVKPVIEIGVLPYVGLTELIKAYGPLAAYLEKELGRHVRIVTARDYQDYLQKSLNHSYPIVVTASHFGRLMELEAGYLPVLRPLNTFHILALVREGSPWKRLADLGGVRIATPGMLAQTTMIGRSILSTQGVQTSALRFIDAGSHKSALLAVQTGEADACFVSEGAFRHMKEEERKGLRQISSELTSERSSIPVIYAISPHVAPADRIHWARLMQKFANDVPEGRAWIDSLKYEGLRPPTREEMKSLDADVTELRLIFNPGIWKR